MTNQRKIFGALLTLALSAFGVDHWFLTPGAAPEQGAPAPMQPAAHMPARKTKNTAAVAAAPAHHTLAARLLEAARAEQLAIGTPDDAGAVPDAFLPSSLWYPKPVAAAPVAAAPAIAPEHIAEFRSRHRLTAVMKTASNADAGGGGLAIIGGRVYTPGQTIDGFTLTSIGERTAVLTRGSASIELAIDPANALTSLSGE